ncbi:MAG: hypothetical protein J6D03_01905 [Clostridia bacterium]|nr:hypothetical protein [Clostridia bacterium]
MNKVINIKEDYIIVFGMKFKLPIKLDRLKEILGQGTIKELDSGTKIYVWEQYGIYIWLNKDIATGIRINLNVKDFKLCNANFDGQILVNDEDYSNIKWKNDEYNIVKEFKIRDFNLYLDGDSEFLSIEFPEDVSEEKNRKYELNHLEDPILKFDNFNFKLCIIQELMYEKNLLLPRFDAYEFAEEYDKREIDIEEEGYEPIKEIVEWFEKIEIPVSMASHIEEIVMDGGNEIYTQIIPFWDGEDDYFDVKDISENEIKQLPNLKRIILLPSKDNAKLIEKLKQYGIEADKV